MTMNFENLTVSPEFTRLFEAHEVAAVDFHEASQANMETTNKAQWQALETTMGEAYSALMNYINAHTRPVARVPHPRELPAYEFTTREGYEVGIQAETACTEALTAHENAARAWSDAADAGMEESDTAQFKALEDASCVAHYHLADVVQAYTAYMSAQAVAGVALLHKPAPDVPAEDAPKLTDVFQHIQELDAALRTPGSSPVPAAVPSDLEPGDSIGMDTTFQGLFAASQNAYSEMKEADYGDMEKADPAQYKKLEADMMQTYHALLAYLDARIAAAAAATQPASGSLPELQSITTNDAYDAAMERYLCAVQRFQFAPLNDLPDTSLLAQAADTVCSEANSVLTATVDAHCAAQVFAALQAIIPAQTQTPPTTQDNVDTLTAWATRNEADVVILNAGGSGGTVVYAPPVLDGKQGVIVRFDTRWPSVNAFEKALNGRKPDAPIMQEST